MNDRSRRVANRPLGSTERTHLRSEGGRLCRIIADGLIDQAIESNERGTIDLNNLLVEPFTLVRRPRIGSTGAANHPCHGGGLGIR